MKYYNNNFSYTPKKHWVKKLLIIIGVLLIIFILTVLYGKYLKNKIANASDNESETEISDTIQNDTASANEIITPSDNTDAKEKQTDISIITIDEEIFTSATTETTDSQKSEEETTSSNTFDSVIADIQNKGYGGIALKMINNDSKLIYSSPAIAEISKQTVNSNGLQYTTLCEYISKINELSLRTTAILDESDLLNNFESTTYIDKLVINELYSAGFKEVILTGIFDKTDPDDTTLSQVCNYLAELRETSPEIYISIELPSSCFLNDSFSPDVEILLSYCDFLSMDLQYVESASNQDATIDALEKQIPSTFNYTNPRLILSGTSDDSITNQKNSFSSYSDNLLFISQ